MIKRSTGPKIYARAMRADRGDPLVHVRLCGAGT